MAAQRRPDLRVRSGDSRSHIRGIFDDDRRLLVIISFNTDIADGWEREGDVPHFFYNFSPPAYGPGTNILICAMTP